MKRGARVLILDAKFLKFSTDWGLHTVPQAGAEADKHTETPDPSEFPRPGSPRQSESD
jgi:hypothetical protein